jgi:carbon-monoxide dehydrogenase medium subunit
MKPGPFTYHRPASVEDAASLLAELDNAKVIAGGQSLVAMMNFRYAMPDHLVDLGTIPELAGISCTDARIEIGAMTCQRDLEFSATLDNHAPLFGAALQHVGHRQTRNRGTIGGSLCHADPAAELPTVCAAYDAELSIQGTAGLRTISMRDFGLGFMATDVAPDEILVKISFTPWAAGHGFSFQEYARRHGDFAVVGVAVLIERGKDGLVERTSIALCGLADRPIRREEAEALLVGTRLDDDTIRRAAAAAADVEAVEDIHATSTYRQHLARTLTTRALNEAWTRAGRIERVAA